MISRRPPPADTRAPRRHTDSPLADASSYERIYAIARQIPSGKVATYGQIAAIEGRCTPRRVGYAMAHMPPSASDVPWQRVLNSAGRVSDRGDDGGGAASQRALLHAEGVLLDSRGRVNFVLVGWPGPDLDWLMTHGLFPAPAPGEARRRR